MTLPLLVNILNMRFRLVPEGVAIIGSPADEYKRSSTDLTRHSEYLSRPFWIAEIPVTQREYFMVTKRRPRYFSATSEMSMERMLTFEECPAVSVSWEDAKVFCELLSRLPDEQQAGRQYRLPSEVEWEYACRAGTETAFNVGADLTSSDANFDGTFPYVDGPPCVYLQRTTPVRSFAPNAFGLFDMHGNVWEWCADLFCSDNILPGKYAPRVLRGGSWHSYARFCRCSARDCGEPDVGYFDQGFRIICEICH